MSMGRATDDDTERAARDADPGWAELRSAVARVLDSTVGLVLAEARLALLSSVTMIVFALLTAGLAFAGWLLLVAAFVYGAHAFGAPLALACAAAALLHVLFAFLLWRYTVGLSRHLQFPLTRNVIVETMAGAPVRKDTIH